VEQSMRLVLGFVTAFSAWHGLPSAAIAQPIHMTCQLERKDDAYAGTCLVPCLVNELRIDINGPRPGACPNPDRRVKAKLKMADRGDHWLGTMDGRQLEDPTRFEVVSSVARTPFGWFRIEKADIAATSVALKIDASRQLPATADDLKIVQRAKALIASEAVWNKQDDRNCPPNPTKWSAFCALMQATSEISGGIHCRQPALQAVREAVNAVGGTRVNKHRLMDYNNHPDTTLREIHGLFEQAAQRLRAEVAP
jgi:hypothetical protein